MLQIETQDMSPEFYEIWRAAGGHIEQQYQGEMRSWLRADPRPPFLEHLSFRLGNQLYFIRVEDADGRVGGPGALRGLFAVAEGCRGHACRMPMGRSHTGNWQPVHGGWGLIDARTGEAIDPVALVTDEKIEMTPWEVHDFAVQVVRNQLETEGFELMSWQGNPSVDPAIWFIGRSAKPEWVVVRAVRYPRNEAKRPPNWPEIVSQLEQLGASGHFASVAFSSADQPFAAADEPAVPLWRGHAVHARFTGLE
jgi:hypothetical protein